MPTRQKDFWKKVLENPDDLILKGSSSNWPLGTLKRPERPSSAGQEDDDISEGITQLREKETAPLEEVT